MAREAERDTLKQKTKEAILQYIKAMDLAAGNRLPSEHKLCEMLEVSRVTVRAALDELVAEGRVFRFKGSGTFVNTAFRRITASLIPYNSFESIIEEHGNIPRVKNLGIEHIQADERLAQALGIDAGAAVVLSKSLIYADDHFCIYNNDFIDRRQLTPKALAQLESGRAAIYEIMYASTGRTVSWDSMELVVADNLRCPELGAHMQEPAGMVKPFLVQQVVSYDAQNTPVFYSEIYFDPDYFRFGLVRKVEAALDKYRRESYTS